MYKNSSRECCQISICVGCTVTSRIATAASATRLSAKWRRSPHLVPIQPSIWTHWDRSTATVSRKFLIRSGWLSAYKITSAALRILICWFFQTIKNCSAAESQSQMILSAGHDDLNICLKKPRIVYIHMKWPWRMFSIPVGSWGWGRLRDRRANWTLLSGHQREWLEKFRLLIIRWCGGRSSTGRAIDRRLDVFADQQQRWLHQRCQHGDGRRPLRRRLRWTLRHQPAGKSSLKKKKKRSQAPRLTPFLLLL